MTDQELFYDTNEAISFITDQTGIEAGIVAKVLDADVEYMRKIGIIDELPDGVEFEMGYTIDNDNNIHFREVSLVRNI